MPKKEKPADTKEKKKSEKPKPLGISLNGFNTVPDPRAWEEHEKN